MVLNKPLTQWRTLQHFLEASPIVLLSISHLEYPHSKNLKQFSSSSVFPRSLKIPLGIYLSTMCLKPLTKCNSHKKSNTTLLLQIWMVMKKYELSSMIELIELKHYEQTQYISQNVIWIDEEIERNWNKYINLALRKFSKHLRLWSNLFIEFSIHRNN